MPIISVNPSTDQTIQSYPVMSADQAQGILRLAAEAQPGWRRESFSQRAGPIRAAGGLLRERVEEWAALMAREMGKPLAQGRSEAEKCAWVCDFYAEQAARFLAPEQITTDASKSLIVFEPMGVILAVMPWNFPFWQVFRAAVPALMAGNAVMLKHASNVAGCALAIERIFRDAGLPDGLFRTLLVETGEVSRLIEHPAIKGVTLTGGTPAGRAVAAKAGEMLKKTVLELGGSDPYLILEDADLEPTVEACVTSRLINAGQSCVAAKRFIVVEPIRSRFEERLVELMRSRRMGDPFEDGVALGPLARRDLRDGLHEQVRATLKQGARRLLGGEVPEGPGAYYPPTVLTDVRPGMAAHDQETFGPVAAVIPVATEAEAIRVANASVFGLGAAVFTRDLKRGERIATEQLEAGSCFVNAYVRSDPRLPFGGIKGSGYGRELSSFGIREFVNIKTVYVK